MDDIEQQTRPKPRMDVGPDPQSPPLSHSPPTPSPSSSPPMQHRKKSKKEYIQLEEREGEDTHQNCSHKGEENTRWHEGTHHHEGEQHYHHLTLPTLPDIETDDAEFVDPTENIDRPTKFVLTSFDKLPKFLADNEYLIAGYRVHFSFKLCWISLFKWHNETLNVWTHLLGTLMFTALMFATYIKFLPKLAKSTLIDGDYLVFAIFFFGAHAQMLFSTIYHLFNAHSATVAKWLARLDYTGICLMIVGSYFPPLYYTLRACHPDLMKVHLSVIAFLGAIGVVVTTLPKLQGPKYRVLRTIFFIVFGMYIFIPLPHMVYLLTFSYMWPILWRLGVMGFLYIAGAAVYATRCPECCCPGKFDFGWYSHPIWHLFVIAAGLMQFYNCIFAFVHYSASPLLCSPAY